MSKRKKTKEQSDKKPEIIGEKPSTTKNHHLLSISFILIIAIAIYSNTLKNGFVHDDEFTIVNNTLIKNFSNISKLFTKEYFSTSGEMSYRPVVTFTYFLDYAIYGIKPWGYHLTNLLLHAMNGVILYIFLTLLITHHSSLITLISLLFITHPVLTEAVNAISYREDLLCFLFFILALIPYIVHRSLLIAHCSKFKAFCFQLLSLSFYLLALLSKEMAITFPLIIFLYEWIYGGKIELPPAFLSLQKGSPQTSPPLQKGRVRVGSLFNPYLIGHIAVTCFYLYLRFFIFHNPVEENIEAWSFSERFMTIPYLILKYLLLLIAPVSLSANYMITPVQSLISLKFIIPFIIVSVLVLVSVNSVRASKTQSPVTSHQLPNPPQSPFTKGGLRGIIVFGIFFLLLTLLPVFNIIPISNPFAERYLYLPSVGFAIIISLLLTCLPVRSTQTGLLAHRSSLIAHCSLLIIISIYSFAVIQRNRIWLDGYSLWSDTVRKTPESFGTHNNLGNEYTKQGRLDESIKEFRMAIKLKPDYANPHNNLGIIYWKQGHIAEAIKEYRMAIKLKPHYVEAHNNLGIAYEKLGQLNEAIKEYKMVSKLNSNYAEAHNNLGDVYEKLGQLNEAIKEYRMAIKLNPDLP